MDQNLALDIVRITESAAMASARWMGRGDKKAADKAATEMMRKNLNKLDIKGKIVIGEGERDKAPMLYIGEEVGKGTGDELDIAVDPLECTNSVAYGKPNALAVLAAAPKGTMLHAPDCYMDKIAVGPEAVGAIDLDASVEDNLKAIARAKDMNVKDLMVMVLDRDRHKQLISLIRATGARITLISDGDISGAIAPCFPDSDVDVLMGIGAAPEGVIASAAINALGGEMQARLKLTDYDGKEIEELKERALKMGIKEPDAKLTNRDLVNTDSAMFVATGVSTGPFLRGVDFTPFGAITNSVAIRQKTGTIRFLETHHTFDDEPEY